MLTTVLLLPALNIHLYKDLERCNSLIQICLINKNQAGQMCCSCQKTNLMVDFKKDHCQILYYLKPVPSYFFIERFAWPLWVIPVCHPAGLDTLEHLNGLQRPGYICPQPSDGSVQSGRPQTPTGPASLMCFLQRTSPISTF